MTRETTILSEIAHGNVHWTAIVDALTSLEATGTLDAEGRAWARVVAQESGHNLNQLRKMQRTLVVFNDVAAIHKTFDLKRLLDTVPFSHAEVLARIVKADEKRGLELIDQYFKASPTPTYRDLLKYFYDVREKTPQASSVAAGQRAARRFEDSCFEMLVSSKARDLPAKFGSDGAKVIRWSGGLRFASPDIVLGFRTPSGNLVVDAVDCFSAYGEISQDETAKRMARTATESTFFRFFWILIAPWSPAQFVLSMRNELKLANVGLVKIDPEKKIVNDSVSPDGGPVPDRQADAEASLKWIFRKL